MGLGELLAPVKGKLTAAVILEVAASVAAIVPFIAIAELGRVLTAPAGPEAGELWLIAIIAALALALRLVLIISGGLLTHLADIELSLDVRRRLVAHLGSAPLGWFTDRNAGTVRKAIQDDVAAMHHLVGHTFLALTSAVVVPLAAFAYLLLADWRLALLTLVPVVVGVGVYGLMMARSMSGFAEYDESMQRLGSGAVEFVQGIAVVKAFGQAGRAHRKFIDAAEDFADFFLAWSASTFRKSAVTEVLMSPPFMLLWVLATGGALVIADWAEPVAVLPFVLLGLSLSAPILALGYSASDIRTANQAASRVGAVLAVPALVQPDEPEQPHGTLVEFDSVSYSYDGASPAVSDVSLTLRPGTVTALVGESGSGKSTLARLLPRFFDVSRGSIRIGGVDVRRLGADRLYSLVTFVFQDVQLLRMSVRDNIALARPDAPEADVIAAARAANIHDRIIELPSGYNSIVGEEARFSGGEAQRVSIARALLADTPIVVLDEATAFADAESEADIQDALSVLLRGRTVLVIAHRLSTITDVDQIVVLDRGYVLEAGRHPELIALGGRYAASWNAHMNAGQSLRTSQEATP